MTSCINTEETSVYSRLSFQQIEGLKDSILIGTYSVYEDRKLKTGRKIPIHIAVSPALNSENTKEPIFIIEGGPGVGAFSNAFFYHNDTLYRQNHDIVYIDVRGTGKSQPLICPELQTKESPQAYFSDRYPLDEVKLCIDRYKDSINFNHYNTQNIVEDLDEIRQWLGYNKINLYAVSYGGTVAIKYMEIFPKSIHKSVLHSPGAPWINNHLERAQWMDNALNELFRECEEAADCHAAYPDLRSEFDEIHQRFKNNEIEIPVQNNQKILLSWNPIIASFFTKLYQATTYTSLPFIIHETYLENYDPLLESMNVYNHELSTTLSLGLYFCISCKETISLPVDSAINYEDTYLGVSTYESRKEVCEIWPVDNNSPQTQKPGKSEVPTIIISGRFDPVCPPDTGKEILSYFTNGQHFIIPAMGHMLWGLHPEQTYNCYDRYLVDFYDDRASDVDVSCFQNIQRENFRLPLAQESAQ